MILTFTDSGVLISAGLGIGEPAIKAFAILGDPDREFASSFYIKMETLPKAQYRQRIQEIAVYQDYFDTVTIWATDWEAIHQEAERQARLYGLGAMDSLHIAAALSVGADEVVTSERPDRSIFRTPDIRVISIYSALQPTVP